MTTETAEITTIEDPLFEWDQRKPVRKNGKLYINPFGVLMGLNLSGQTRASEVLADKAFMNTTKKLGVVQPIIVQQIDYRGAHVYSVVAGNRRTAALRQLIASGEVTLDDPRALLPIYEMNAVELENVSSENAVNLLENAMRKRLDPIAKAHAIEAIMSSGATKEEVALLITGQNNKPLGGPAIQQYRQLLKLHPSLQKAVQDGILHLNKASTMTGFSEAEQLAILQEVMDAQDTGRRSQAQQEAINAVKAKKRRDVDGDIIHEPPRVAGDIRRKALAFMVLPENWKAIKNAPAVSPEGYQLIASVFGEFSKWCDGGLTPKNCKPDDLLLTLRTRILGHVRTYESRK